MTETLKHKTDEELLEELDQQRRAKVLASVAAKDFKDYNNTALGEALTLMKEGLKDNPEDVDFGPIVALMEEFKARGKAQVQFWIGLQEDWPKAARFKAAYKKARAEYPSLPKLIAWAGSKKDFRSRDYIPQGEMKVRRPIYK